MSELRESPSDNPDESTTCYHCKCANAAARDFDRHTVDPEICYAEQSEEDQSLNDSGSHRQATNIVWHNLSPPKHLGGSQVAPIVTARHLDIMRAKLAGRFDRNKKIACKRISGDE